MFEFRPHFYLRRQMKQWIIRAVQTAYESTPNKASWWLCAPRSEKSVGSIALLPPSPTIPLLCFPHCPRCFGVPHTTKHPDSHTCAAAVATHEQLRSPWELGPLDNLRDLCCGFFACRLRKLWLLSTFIFFLILLWYATPNPVPLKPEKAGWNEVWERNDWKADGQIYFYWQPCGLFMQQQTTYLTFIA